MPLTDMQSKRSLHDDDLVTRVADMHPIVQDSLRKMRLFRRDATSRGHLYNFDVVAYVLFAPTATPVKI